MISQWKESEWLSLGNDMVAAAEQVVNLEQHGLRQFLDEEVSRILVAIQLIRNMETEGSVDMERSKMLLNMQREAFESLLLTVRGIKLVEKENLVNGVMDVVAGAVKRWWGLVL